MFTDTVIRGMHTAWEQDARDATRDPSIFM
ncbi:hypothetical protein MXD60_22235 [Frankia sp. AgB32]|nr:hypothetical protein [Frankia sp. AgB32]